MIANELRVVEDSFAQSLVVQNQVYLDGTKQNQPKSDERSSRLLDILYNHIGEVRLLINPDVAD